MIRTICLMIFLSTLPFCSRDYDPPTGLSNKVEVETGAVTSISSSSAAVDGAVLSDGGTLIVERGIVLSTMPSPSTSQVKRTSGAGIGHFSVNISGLAPNTTYYLRAYAINSLGTVYGQEELFRTLLQTPMQSTPAQGIQLGCCNLNFSWSAVAGASQYELQLSRNSSFTGAVFNQPNCSGSTVLQVSHLNVALVSGNSYCVRGGTSVNNGVWYWRVRSRSNTNSSEWSPVRYFVYAA